MPEDKTWLNHRGVQLSMALFLAGLFALAYTQSPLYTSNQNQYFLHGLARAGFGYLDQDWLANTLDPTPVFSYLVYLTFRITQQPALFYLYYAVLLGIYLFSLVGIINDRFHFERFSTRWWVLVTLIFLVHSAALRFFFSTLLSDNWTYLLEDGLADQRLLGPVFQPSTFGVLLLLSIYLFLKKHPFFAVLLAALAATIHPTYLLGAGALTLAFMVETYRQDKKITKSIQLGLIALLGVTPILIYVYTSFANTPPLSTARAQEILVSFRIPFHAVFQRWFDLPAIIKIGLMLSAIYLVRRTSMFYILFVPFLIASALTTLQVILDSNSLALLFPWRISTWLVPISVGILLGELVMRLFGALPDLQTRHRKIILLVCFVLLVSLTVIGLIRVNIDFSRKASLPERGVMNFVAETKQEGQYYLIPLDMQDFRLTTGAPIYVEFKSIPYKDQDVLEWRRRLQISDLFYKKGTCADLEKLSKIGLTHVIATSRQYKLECEAWQLLYQDENYAVFELR